MNMAIWRIKLGLLALGLAMHWHFESRTTADQVACATAARPTCNAKLAGGSAPGTCNPKCRNAAQQAGARRAKPDVRPIHGLLGRAFPARSS